VRNNIETAADYRKEAMLALDARNKGKLTTRDVIAKFEEVTQLDPGVHLDWVELGRLDTDAGQLGTAKAAAQQSADTAESDRDRLIAAQELGDVLVAQGDLAGARARFQDSLATRQRLAAANPSSAELQRDLVVSLAKLTNVPGSGVRWRQVAVQVERMRQRGILPPRDAWMVEDTRQQAVEKDGEVKPP
jgi:tetratricopeptide (TPR) repeat protein